MPIVSEHFRSLWLDLLLVRIMQHQMRPIVNDVTWFVRVYVPVTNLSRCRLGHRHQLLFTNMGTISLSSRPFPSSHSSFFPFSSSLFPIPAFPSYVSHLPPFPLPFSSFLPSLPSFPINPVTGSWGRCKVVGMLDQRW